MEPIPKTDRRQDQITSFPITRNGIRIMDIPTDRIMEYTAKVNAHKLSMLIN